MRATLDARWSLIRAPAALLAACWPFTTAAVWAFSAFRLLKPNGSPRNLIAVTAPAMQMITTMAISIS